MRRGTVGDHVRIEVHKYTPGLNVVVSCSGGQRKSQKLPTATTVIFLRHKPKTITAPQVQL